MSTLRGRTPKLGHCPLIRMAGSEYDEFLRTKVDAARQSMRADQGSTSEEVEAKFAARRAELARTIKA